jgi:putative ABC transport system permease protein
VKISRFEDQINRVYYEHHLKNDNKTYEAYLKTGKQPSLFVEPFKDIHNFPRLGKSSFKTTMILFALALLLLISGALNAGNLSLVKALQRNREIGVRKVLGASKMQIFKQFLIETSAQCMISLVFAVGLLFIVLPWFNKMFGLSLSVMHLPFAGKVILQVIVALVAIVLIAGLYPAWLFARQTAMAVLRQQIKMSTSGFRFNNALLVVQFAVSMFFIVSALLMLQQMNYMKKRDIGFSPEQVVQLQVTQDTWENNFANTKTKLMEIPGVQNVAKTTEVPGAKVDTISTRFGYNGKPVDLSSVRVSTQFFQTLNIPIKEGRSFDDEHPEDLDNTAIINETAAKMLGAKGVVGASIHFDGCDSVPYKIVGIAKDFQVQGFENRIRPAFYSISNAHCTYMAGSSLLLKVSSANMDKTLAALTTTWEGIEPGMPLRYSFLDDNFARLFENYSRVQHLVQVFTIISVTIALMGLLALAVYVTGQRNKEISIRKVLGASMGNLVLLLSADFLKLVLIAIVLISPLAWYLLEYWLKDFAYRVNISWEVFGLAALVVIAMAMITVGWQAIRASAANPAANLKGE